MANLQERLVQALLVALIATVSPAAALDVSGIVHLIAASSDRDGVESDADQQLYSLQLHQTLTPFLSARLAYLRRDNDSQTAEADPFSRRITQPRFSLNYGRRTFSAFLSATGQTVETSTATRDIDSEAFRAGFNWRPTLAFTLAGSVQDLSNSADASVFGRRSEIRSYGLSANYLRTFWGANYTYSNSDYLSANGFGALQERHELGLRGSRDFFNSRLLLNFNSNVSRLDRQDKVLEGAELVEPVPVLNGLFAVDTTPEFGELTLNQGLVDGDVLTPAPPGIDIGGGATFRNIGLNLGINNQLTRLEISVNALSGRDVIWQVYQSIDNLVWERVTGVTSEFDTTFLRYELHFPLTVSRYIKAVNVSPNSEPLVRVTELRALLDLDSPAPETGSESTRYRATAGVSYLPVDRVRLAVDIGGSNDSQVSAGLVKREFEEYYGGALISIDLPSDLNLGVRYRFEDTKDFRQPVLLRSLESSAASLEWHPMPTFEAVLLARTTEETEAGDPLQSNDSLGLEALTVLLPGLRLTSALRFSSVTDEVTALTRDHFSLEERLETQPTANWSLGGRLNFSWFDSTEDSPIRSRLIVDLDTSWRISPYLNFNGIWTMRRDQVETFVQQSYNIGYVRGKLRLSGSFQQSDSRGFRTTQISSASAGYRLNTHLRFDISFSSSQFKGSEVVTSKNTSILGSLRIIF